ncbi:hypothetical protein NBRC116587_06430 [Pseudoteredinibacter isoporae]
MKFSLSRFLPQSLWLFVLASALLWGQIVNAQHIHLENHAPHECISCQQLNTSEAAASPPLLFSQTETAEPGFSEKDNAPLASALTFNAIRAPPSI